MVKHFLDSSVAQPILLGSSAYKKYLLEQFADGNIYISHYVQMEIKRSCIIPFIDFYFVLDFPTIKTMGDAIACWSNKFGGKEIKAAMRLMGVFIDTNQLSNLSPADKPKIKRRLGLLIKRIELKLRAKFINIGENATRCTRSEILMIPPQWEGSTIEEQLKQFSEKFNDIKYCRSQCKVDDFFLNRFSDQVGLFFEQANNLAKPKSPDNRGFVKITKKLEEIVKKGGEACSCRMCGDIGDAVIALELPADMQLEHTDRSFDNLCEAVSKLHQRHPAEPTFHKQKSS